ncbi:MAG TPA: hypothetical protein VL974_08015, partial [Magnetospirillum sp.]|nr:hypothetical protein [Magnetospirillum sp.]
MDAFAPAEASVIWLHLVALELAAGALAFLTLVVKPRCQGAPQVWGRMICGSRRLAQISIAAAAATLFAWLWLAFRGILDSPSQIDPHFLASFILKTQFGRS